jgi:hypothetical protein
MYFTTHVHAETDSKLPNHSYATEKK